MARGVRLLLRLVGDPWLLLRARLVYWVYGVEAVCHLLRFCSKRQTSLLLRAFGAQVGEGCDLEAPIIIHNAARDFSHLRIGSDCHVGKEVLFDLMERVEIEDRVTLSMRVTIVTHIDVGKSPLREGPLPTQYGAVRIGRGAYIGAGAIILHGVTVGEGSAIGAGSLVLKDVAPGTLVAGNPARPIRSLIEQEQVPL
ncbi:MAG: acyltransferase [Chloroflexi bacterium]|nr:acyltransferase [Chloroflexota bacterium]MCL5026415.1 acyltransferase [Chloroflexota bacterium]